MELLLALSRDNSTSPASVTVTRRDRLEVKRRQTSSNRKRRGLHALEIQPTVRKTDGSESRKDGKEIHTKTMSRMHGVRRRHRSPELGGQLSDIHGAVMIVISRNSSPTGGYVCRASTELIRFTPVVKSVHTGVNFIAVMTADVLSRSADGNEVSKPHAVRPSWVTASRSNAPLDHLSACTCVPY